MIKVALLLKKNKKQNKKIISFLRKKTKSLNIFIGDVESKIPKKIFFKKYDIIISYLSPWIIPNKILRKTKFYNINFHPGPPTYPGIGCFNFAIYDRQKKYGVTSHIMKNKVDSGKIIGVKYFKVKKNCDVRWLMEKSYKAMFILFVKIINEFFQSNELKYSKINWKRKPLKRKDLEKLCQLNFKMNKKEFKKRIQSTYFEGKPGPYLKINNLVFEFNPKR